jgi:UDP-N-acetylmuramoyl-L-alanyl-D-glutamate--2,6-diaminopimelate ligase
MSLRLDQLLAGFADVGKFAALHIGGLTLDSRAVRAGDAFVALQGVSNHGLRFASAAIAAGAAVVLADDAGAETFDTDALPVVVIDGLRDKLGLIAARFYGNAEHPSRVIGVTGTNGKTSTVQLIAQAMAQLGRPTATIGTLGAGLPGALDNGERTTPDAITVQRLFAQFREQGAQDVAMEVSSHALQQGRVNAVPFRVAVFTNLTRDHLDYHGTMEAYGAAKARLFAMPSLEAAVINVDDEFGRQLVAQIDSGVRVLCYSTRSLDVDIRASDIETDSTGLRFALHTPWGGAVVQSRLLGRFNVSNLLAVATTLGALGFNFASIVSALAVLDPVPGRMSRLGGGALPLVVVDYAHTPDALEQTLGSLRAHCAGVLACVFGCGGERDAGKRPQMAEIAERLADKVFVTDDNPRSEDGDRIVADIMKGFIEPDAIVVERDRAAAIHRSIAEAARDDIVLIAGKGHETYQEINGQRFNFDDLLVADHALEAREC